MVLHGLGTKPLWLDEAVSVSVAGRPVVRILSVLPHRDANAGLYYLALHVWLRLGHGAAWDRGLSAASFVATAGLAAWIGTRWRGPWLGWAAGVLIATDRFLVFYGQEARPYAPAVLLALASTAALVWRQGRPAPRAYVALTAVLLYVDLFAALFVAAEALAVVGWHRLRGTERPEGLGRCWVAIAALSSPVWLLATTVEHGQIAWLGHPTPAYVVATVRGLAGGWAGFVLMAGLAGLAAVVVALPVVANRGAERRRPSRDGLVVAVLAAAWLLPPVALWLWSLAVPSFVDRYVICSALALIGLAALGLDELRRRAGAVAAAVCLVGLAVLGWGHVARLERAPFKYENPPAVVAFIRARMQPGDAIGFGSGGLRTVLDLDAPAGGPGLPADVALAPHGEAWRQPDVYGRQVSPAVLAARLSGLPRLWLVTDPSDGGYPSSGPFAPLRAAVQSAYRLELTAPFPGMTVALYARP